MVIEVQWVVISVGRYISSVILLETYTVAGGLS